MSALHWDNSGVVSFASVHMSRSYVHPMLTQESPKDVCTFPLYYSLKRGTGIEADRI